MRKISRISLIVFNIFLIVGIIFLIVGVDYYSRTIREFDPYPELGFARLIILTGLIIIILTVTGGIYFYSKSPPKLEVKKDYMNIKWLNHQYYELGRSLQVIANDQGVSMMTVKKWVDKLDIASVDVGVKE